MKRKAEEESARAQEDACEEFASSLSGLCIRAREMSPAWEAALECVRGAAALTDEDLVNEGRAQALLYYGAEAAPHFWPEPPSMTILIRYSVRSDLETTFAEHIDRFVASVAQAKSERLSKLKHVKQTSPENVEAVRELGKGCSALVKIVNQARDLDKPVRERLGITAARISSYRNHCSSRSLLTEARLVDVPPTRSGYEQILDFYRLTDAAEHSFGRSLDGPQFFTDIRRNVAILHATRLLPAAKHAPSGLGHVILSKDTESAGCLGITASQRGSMTDTRQLDTFFSAYAVSGVDAPGLNPVSSEGLPSEGRAPPGPFEAIVCEDGLGESYQRDHDAEFKLVSALCSQQLAVRAPGDVNTDYHGRITLWSKKPLCASCDAVIHRQLAAALPNAEICVRIDDEQQEETSA